MDAPSHRHPIVVAVDFTENAETAFRQALRLAAVDRVDVHVVHVVESQVLSELHAAIGAAPDNLKQQVLDDAATRLGDLIRRTPAEGYRLEGEGGTAANAGDGPRIVPYVRLGHPVEEILGAVEAREAGLLLLARNSTSKPERGAGTCAVQCVRKSPSSVLLVRQNQAGRFRRIVVGVDFSDDSQCAVRRGIELAQRDGAILDLVHVYYPPWEVVHFTGMPVEATPQFQQQYRRTLEDRLHRLAKSYEGALDGSRINAKVLAAATHAIGLVDHLEAVDADLAVLASHGRSAIRRLLLGSTAEQVIREAPCSVLTVRRSGEDR